MPLLYATRMTNDVTPRRFQETAEWEYAARAGTTNPRHGQLDAVAWHYSNAHDQSQRVKTKRANAWGLHDMIGNVSEWCSDWYGYYPAGTVTDPKGPRSAEYVCFAVAVGPLQMS